MVDGGWGGWAEGRTLERVLKRADQDPSESIEALECKAREIARRYWAWHEGAKGQTHTHKMAERIRVESRE